MAAEHVGEHIVELSIGLDVVEFGGLDDRTGDRPTRVRCGRRRGTGSDSSTGRARNGWLWRACYARERVRAALPARLSTSGDAAGRATAATPRAAPGIARPRSDRKSTRLNSSH